MRYGIAEKPEIIRLVEQSPLPVRHTLVKLGIPRATERELSHHFLQRAGLPAQLLDLLSGLRGEDSIAELCRREGIVQNLYYRWSKEFLATGKKRPAGDTARAATSDGFLSHLRSFNGYDGPEIFPSSIRHFWLIGADAGQ
jgi:hypothetical protein